MLISASHANLLTFMEMRHHAGAKVGVLVIDEQQNFTVDADRQAIQKSVMRTATILGCPVWFAEIGPGEASDTHVPLIRAAGFRSSAAAVQGGAVLRKGNKTNVFAGSNLGARLSSAGIEFLVVMGQYAGCCVAHSILGTPKYPPRPKDRAPKHDVPTVGAPTVVVPNKPLPKPPSESSGKLPAQPLPSTSAAFRVPSKPLPVPPSLVSGEARPTARPTLRQYDEIRRKPLPPLPRDKGVSAAPKLDAVSYCTVLTSPSLVNGDLPSSVKNHPKCLVFEAVGAEMWPAEFSQRMADQVMSAGRHERS